MSHSSRIEMPQVDPVELNDNTMGGFSEFDHIEIPENENEMGKHFLKLKSSVYQ